MGGSDKVVVEVAVDIDMSEVAAEDRAVDWALVKKVRNELEEGRGTIESVRVNGRPFTEWANGSRFDNLLGKLTGYR